MPSIAAGALEGLQGDRGGQAVAEEQCVWSGLRWSVRPKALWELQGWGRECARWTLSSAGRSLGKGLEVQVELSHSGQHSQLRSSTCRESRIRGRAEAGESVTHKESGPG